MVTFCDYFPLQVGVGLEKERGRGGGGGGGDLGSCGLIS
jgi:hypothetical protein